MDLPFLSVYRVISLLGTGAFGVVLEVQNLHNNEISALKVASNNFIVFR
jgi:serine/threonine protein kinase